MRLPDDVVVQFSAETGVGNCWYFDDDISTFPHRRRGGYMLHRCFADTFESVADCDEGRRIEVCIQYDRGSGHL